MGFIRKWFGDGGKYEAEDSGKVKNERRYEKVPYSITGNGVLHVKSKDIIRTTAALRQIDALKKVKV